MVRVTKFKIKIKIFFALFLIKNFQLSKENKKYNCNTNDIDLTEDETSMKKVLPLDTIIYITSEQVKSLILEYL